MNNDYDFQKELKNSIFNADPKLDRNELLIDIFKSYVAKMFELVITKKGLPYDSLVQIKANLINEFMNAELSEYQKNTKWYDKLFDDTVKEILNFAAHQHSGQDMVADANQTLQINPEVYINEGGLIKPISSM